VTDEKIRVEVAYAREKTQALLAVQAEPGLSIRDAIERSGMLQRFPEIDLGVNKVGIFGKVAALDATLTDGDRVEIYPPLIADPKQARKARAAGAPDKQRRAGASDASGA
jgi:putative ubiquitin-RnfH superfamily antitoxin RatB of RatAB toxin-antitoxin module